MVDFALGLRSSAVALAYKPVGRREIGDAYSYDMRCVLQSESH